MKGFRHTPLKNYPVYPNPGKVSHTCGSKSPSKPLDKKSLKFSYMVGVQNVSIVISKLGKNDIYIYMGVATSSRHA